MRMWAEPLKHCVKFSLKEYNNTHDITALQTFHIKYRLVSYFRFLMLCSCRLKQAIFLLFINNSVFNLSLSDNLLVNLHRFWIY